MALALLLVWRGLAGHDVVLFFCAYLLLITATGVGNGSTYRMIPAIFHTRAAAGIPPSDTRALALAAAAGRRDASAAVGVISAVGAFGGFFINRGFGASVGATGNVSAALAAFAAFYAVCLALTWFGYLRRPGPAAATGPAAARV